MQIDAQMQLAYTGWIGNIRQDNADHLGLSSAQTFQQAASQLAAVGVAIDRIASVPPSGLSMCHVQHSE